MTEFWISEPNMFGEVVRDCWFCDNPAMQDSLVCQSCSEEFDQQLNDKYKNMKKLLELLDRPATAKELANKLGVCRSTVYNYLKELEKRNFVARRRVLNRNRTNLWIKVDDW